MDASTERPSRETTTPSEIPTGIWKYESMIILTPTNTRIAESPYFRYANMRLIPAIAKYIVRSHKIANVFDVYTMNESRVIAKMAGTESSAKITSMTST